MFNCLIFVTKSNTFQFPCQLCFAIAEISVPFQHQWRSGAVDYFWTKGHSTAISVCYIFEL